MKNNCLYIHVPFCRKKCFYCDFYSVAGIKRIDDFVDALCREIFMERLFLGNERALIKTIYFGGGTPSLLKRAAFEKIFSALNNNFDLSLCREITIEANPDDLSPDYIAMIKDFPINRISIGVQSFNDAELVAVNRRHDSFQARKAVEDCYKSGLENISVDLMYGLPGQTSESLSESLKIAVSLPVNHISTYALSWEEGSILYRKLQDGELTEASDEWLEKRYFEICKTLSLAGYEHYELSNFCKPGFESKHNSSYWNGSFYLGLGPGAHSYNGNSRSWNINSLNTYISNLNNGVLPERGSEILSRADKYNDFVMTRLRTKSGISFTEFSGFFDVRDRDYLMKNARRNIDSGLIVADENGLRLSGKALFVADSVISDLFYC